MIEIRQYDTLTEDFKELDAMLDEDYYERFGQIALEYRRFNTLEGMVGFVVAYDGRRPVGCGCIRPITPETAELKRIFVCKDYRRKGLAGKIVASCEEMARQNGFQRMHLQTGAVMNEAIALYQKQGYEMIENYGEFAGDENSVCMAKELAKL